MENKIKTKAYKTKGSKVTNLHTFTCDKDLYNEVKDFCSKNNFFISSFIENSLRQLLDKLKSENNEIK